MTNKALPSDTVIFGEIGLSGEIRAVSQASARLKEAEKLGFKSAIAPSNLVNKEKAQKNRNIAVHEIGNVQRLINWFS